MTEIVLFHHALGLTPGVVGFAEQLRSAGHTVHTPDLFEGRTFDSIESGVAHAEQIGFGEVLERGARAVADLPAEVVYLGMSLGVLPAQRLAQTRPGARGAIFYYSCVPAAEFGSWPDGLAGQVHGAERDPIFMDEGDVDAARELAASTGTRRAVPLSRRPALLRRQHAAVLRRGLGHPGAAAHAGLPRRAQLIGPTASAARRPDGVRAGADQQPGARTPSSS